MKKETTPKVTIMATSYNTMLFIEKFMASVMAQTYPNFQILIIDDHSTDDSYQWLQAHYGKHKKVTIIRNAKNLRLARSRSKGLQLADGKYVTIMDVDTVVDKNWIKASVDLMETRPDIAAVQSVVYDLLEPNVIEFAGIRLIPKLGWVVIKDFGKKSLTGANKLYETFPGPTGIVYRKDIFKELGYFDEKIGFNIDDVDFGLRFTIAGYRAFVNPKAVTYHLTMKPSQEREKVIKRLEWEFQFMKMPRIFIKNYQWSTIIVSLPIYFLIIFGRTILWLTRGNMQPLKAFFWALGWNIKLLPNTLAERKSIQRLRKIPDSEVFLRVGVAQYSLLAVLRNWSYQVKAATKWSKRVKDLPSAKFLSH